MDRKQVYIFCQNKLIGDALQCFITQSDHSNLNGRQMICQMEAPYSASYLTAEVVILELNSPFAYLMPQLMLLRKANQSAAFMVISDIGKEGITSILMELRVSSFLLRCCTSRSIFLSTLEKLHGGENYYCSAVTKRLLYEASKQPGQKDNVLTEREKEVLLNLVREMDSTKVAANLFLSPSTVKTHRRNIMRKLNAHSYISLIEKARDMGILNLSDIPLCANCKYQALS